MSQRILIVDDEDDIREFIGYNLRREGYDIYTATNGKEAVEMAVSTLPHLIILDMMMPVMDGRQACEEIRKIPELNETIIVFLSAVQEEQCQIESYLAENNIDVAVLTVPGNVASTVAKKLAACGVKAIWNFTNVEIELPKEEVIVENMHFSDSLLALSYRISHPEEY